MAVHLIVGAGPVGSAVARHLLADGEAVRVLTRSGTGIDGVERIAADAADPAALTAAALGASAIYNCVNPPYDKWAQQWPPIAAALLRAAETSGAVLATTGNLYVYGPVDRPMTEDMPMAATGAKGQVRAQMTRDALAAHAAGRIRAFEVRGSDYLGGNSLLGTLVAPAWRKGRTAYIPADLDASHTWTNVDDVATLLVTGVRDERAWGRVWHVPSAAPLSIRELTAIAAQQLGVRPKVAALPYPALWTVGLFQPFVRELRETQHQFRRPFVLDSTLAEQTFGLKPTAIQDSVALDLATTS
ncbi:MAG TPA: NAD-dependent epimerase/dehydratase family protein [Jatrophihabitantaceae bacterium]|nr:NAD-dependent epimerase/dehydratase family protein [Jatrophihabitantaceae bacterium]